MRTKRTKPMDVMAPRKRKGRQSPTCRGPEEHASSVASTTQDELEVAALLSGGLICSPKLPKAGRQSSARTRESPPPKKQSFASENGALEILSHGCPDASFPVTEACPSTTDADKCSLPSKATSKEQAEAYPTTASSPLVCVTPDTDKMKNQELQKRSLDVERSMEEDTLVSLDKDPTASSILQEALQILSSVFLISSNALVDQIKYLPDSVVPAADYSYDEHDEDNMDEQAETLRREFGHLLWDRETQRADFVGLPKNVLQLLRGVWNVSEDPSVTDRVGKRLVPVQSFFPNLLNYLLRTSGFPTASDVFDSDIFRSSGKKKVKAIENEFKSLLRNTMENMGYPCSGHDIEFYLSFMRTRKRTVVQDPHIDFRHETVDPWFVDESPTTRRGRGRRLGYKERVPFIAFFPLTPDGMAVEVWEARDDHRFGRPGVLVHIPYGCMMMARGDLVHAGGFSNSSRGNPRCHLYSE